MQLQEMMSTRVVTIHPSATADAARSLMKRHRIRHLVATEDSRIAGILSERDLRGPGVEDRTVRDLMTPDVVTAGPQTTLDEAVNLMLSRLIGCLPVVEDARLVGIVTASDVLDELGSEAQIETPGTRKRAPFQPVLPKALKPIAGRAKAPLIPAHIRVVGVRLTEDDRAGIRRKLGARLGKFADSIERVSVRVKDVNGPRGGIDQLCRIKVVLSELASVVFEHQDASAQVAIDGAIAGTERAVRKALQRRRTKPVKAVRARAQVRTA